jgi:hypothetical protein
MRGVSEREGAESTGFLFLSTARWRASGHVSSEGERGCHMAYSAYARSAELQFKINYEAKNTTSNIHWNINRPPFVTPNPFSFGTTCSNESCRAMRDLQLCLKCQSLIWPGWRATRLQSGVHETKNWISVSSRLKLRYFPLSNSQIEQWKAKPITPWCRTIRGLQLCLMDLALVHLGLKDIHSQRTVHEN